MIIFEYIRGEYKENENIAKHNELTPTIKIKK